jgi:hypothetical protein
MPRKVRELLVCSYNKEMLSDEEFVLLYDANKERNPDFPYWAHERFHLDEVTDAECRAEFLFYRNDIYNLADVLRLPNGIVEYNGLVVEYYYYYYAFTSNALHGDMITSL